MDTELCPWCLETEYWWQENYWTGTCLLRCKYRKLAHSRTIRPHFEAQNTFNNLIFAECCLLQRSMFLDVGCLSTRGAISASLVLLSSLCAKHYRPIVAV